VFLCTFKLAALLLKNFHPLLHCYTLAVRSVFLYVWMCISGPAIGGEDVYFRTLLDSHPWSRIARLGARK